MKRMMFVFDEFASRSEEDPLNHPQHIDGSENDTPVTAAIANGREASNVPRENHKLSDETIRHRNSDRRHSYDHEQDRKDRQSL